MSRLLIAALAASSFATSPLAAQTAESYDLVIANGRVLDGTGNPFVLADVAIRDGRIAAVGQVERSRATRVIDATGHYVTPGFIDLHSHSANASDGMILHPEGRTGHNSVTQGITTEAVNPPWPLAEKLEQFRAGGHALNLVVSVNHNDLRRMVLGMENRLPTDAELERMRDMIRQAFSEGARYLFVNLENGMPARFARTDELVELAKVVEELGGYYDTHQRSEGISPIWYYPSGRDHRPESDGPVVDGVEAVRETVEIAERSGARVVGHHVKVKGPNFWGASQSYVELVKRARERGAQVYFSIYGYDSYGNQPSVRVIPPWALADPGVDSRIERSPPPNGKANFQRVLDTPELRRDLVTDIEYQFTKAGGPDRLLLVRYPDERYAGKTLQEIAEMRNESAVDALIWLQLNGENRAGGGGFRALDTGDEDVRRFIRQDFTAYVTDGGNIVPGEGYPHPRYYGTYPRFLRRYALDEPVITLPHAIRAMTSLAAQIVGLEDRGRLEPGYWADINVIDPITIRDHATYMNPHEYSTGLRWVLINGVPVVEDGERTGALPGRVLGWNQSPAMN